MARAATWSWVIVGSWAATLACSSTSSSGSLNPNPGDDTAANSSDGGGSSGGSSGGGSSGGDATASASCPNPLDQISAVTGASLPAGCSTCVSSHCSSQLDDCATSSCTSCGVPLYECAQSSCSSACFPHPEAGTSSSSSSGSSSGGSSSGSSGSGGAAGSCAQLQSCCAFGVECGCTAVGFISADAGAACSSAVSSNNTAECSVYYSAVKTEGAAFSVTCSM